MIDFIYIDSHRYEVTRIEKHINKKGQILKDYYGRMTSPDGKGEIKHIFSTEESR